MARITRRGFMGIILASATMPAIVRANSLMGGVGFRIPAKHIILPGSEIISPELSGGKRIFTTALGSLGFLDAQSDGLVELRRYIGQSHVRMKAPEFYQEVRTSLVYVDFELPRLKPRYQEKTIW